MKESATHCPSQLRTSTQLKKVKMVGGKRKGKAQTLNCRAICRVQCSAGRVCCRQKRDLVAAMSSSVRMNVLIESPT